MNLCAHYGKSKSVCMCAKCTANRRARISAGKKASKRNGPLVAVDLSKIPEPFRKYASVVFARGE